MVPRLFRNRTSSTARPGTLAKTVFTMRKVSIAAARAFIVALFAFWCQTSFAQSFEVDGIKYNVTSQEEKECEVGTQYNSDITGSVIIPETVTYEGQVYSVTSIGWSAFQDCSGLTSISIPDGVTSIGWYAFRHCSGLTSIRIPNGVTSIEPCTFSDCPDMVSISIPDGVVSIGDAAFDGCSGLANIRIPDGVTSIGAYAFRGCSGLYP